MKNINNLFLKILKSKYYNFKIINNIKYNKNIKKYYINNFKNFDFRNDIKFKDLVLCNNNWLNKFKFVKCFRIL
uniref:Ribosomal protein S17 n=1 Tax=Babesia rodhaini TaxID=5870 RepID=A0A455QZB3_BABRO|nr:hypothetical protein [Babesia rodhaini]